MALNLIKRNITEAHTEQNQDLHNAVQLIVEFAVRCIDYTSNWGRHIMTKLKATPKNFAEALQFIIAEGKGKLSLRIGNNTYLEYHTGKGTGCTESITVRLHTTYIVKFWPSGRTELYTGGYRTVTTKERINQFITGRVWQKAHQWYYTPDALYSNGAVLGNVPFEEGIEVRYRQIGGNTLSNALRRLKFDIEVVDRGRLQNAENLEDPEYRIRFDIFWDDSSEEDGTTGRAYRTRAQIHGIVRDLLNKRLDELEETLR